MDTASSSENVRQKKTVRGRIIGVLFVLYLGKLMAGTGITVTTVKVTDILASSAVLTGEFSTPPIEFSGGGGCSEIETAAPQDANEEEEPYVGFVYAITSVNNDPQAGGQGCVTVKVAGPPISPFEFEVTGLVPGTEYSFRALHSACKDFPGELKTFTTLGIRPETTSTSEILGDGILASSLQADGRTLLGGDFSLVGGKVHRNLVRLSPDGSVDGTYKAGVSGASGSHVAAIASQSDGKVLVGGEFNEVNGVIAPANLVRLDAAGNRDATFAPVVGNGPVECLAIQADGKILVGGKFVSLGGNTRYNTLARLDPDGSLDTTFNSGTAAGGANVNANDTVRSIAILKNGQILISGDFNAYNGTPRDGFARLNSDGTIDASFNPGFRPDSFAVLPDEGKILVGAFFASITPPGYGVARLNSDGSKDLTFATADPDRVVRVNGPVNALLVQADGAVVIGGPTLVNGSPTKGVARLSAVGVHESGYNPDFDYVVSSLGLLGNGGLIIGGSESALTGEKELIAVVTGTTPAATLRSTSATRVEWLRGGAVPEVSQVSFEISTNSGAAWTPFASGSRISGGWEATGTLPAVGLLRARGRTVEGSGNASSGLIEQIESFPAAGADAPVVVNPSVSLVGARTATIGGEVTQLGNPGITERGVVVARTADSSNPFVGSTNAVTFLASGSAGIGVYSVDTRGLVPGTHYTFRAYAKNANGTRYSPTSTFVTLGAPVVSKPTFATITDNSAVLGGTIDSNRGSAITRRGVLVIPITVRAANRLVSSATATLSFVDNNSADEEITVNAAGLIPDTEYRFAAFATNQFGTSYSPFGTFITTGASPSETSEEPDFISGSGWSSVSSTPEEAGTPGNLDGGFDPGAIDGIVQVIAVQPDGGILIAGEFNEVQGEVRTGLARLDPTGLLDLGFDMTTDGVIYTLRILPNGRLLVGGFFLQVNGRQTQRLALLEEDGSLVDRTEFDIGGGVDGIVYTTALQEDGKILIGGFFDSVQGVARSHLARLHPDGSLDEDFDPVANDAVYSLAVQSDGKILVGGNFTTLNAVGAGRLARLESDGDLDGSFDPGAGANGRIVSLAPQADGKILLTGEFTRYDGTTRNRVARILPDGLLDTAFNPGTGANGPIYTFAVQTDGTILLGGDFTSLNGNARNRIARLLANGALDATFDPGAGADAEVSAVALQEDGGILIGGDFVYVDGELRSRLARFENAAATETFTVVNGRTVDWLRGGAGPELQDAALEFSNNGGLSWETHGTAARILGGWRFGGDKLPLAGMVRARGNTAGGFLGASAGLVEASSAFDHTTRVAALRASLISANAGSAKLQKQIKAAKKKKNTSKVKKLTKQLKTLTTRINATRGDLANY